VSLRVLHPHTNCTAKLYIIVRVEPKSMEDIPGDVEIANNIINDNNNNNNNNSNNNPDPDNDNDHNVKVIDPSLLEDGELELKLPESIYSCVIMLPLCENLSKYKSFINLQIYFCHWCNIYVQTNLLYYVYVIYNINRDEFGGCGGYETEPMIRYCCVLIYTAYCIGDICETIKMFLFITNFPSCDTFEYLRYKQACDDDSDDKELATGMTKKWKIFCFLFVIVPKLGVACALLGYGTGFVVNTQENSDLILNALALGFVLEIDEMSYEYFLSYQMQDILDNLPPITLKPGRTMGLNRDIGIIMKGVMLGLMTAIAYQSFCGDDEPT